MFYITDENGNPISIAGTGANPNLDCLRTEVVYDMTSSDVNKNWGYTSGIQGGVTVSGKDFSKYKVLRVYVNYANTITQIGDIDMNLLVDNTYRVAQRCGTQSISNANFYFSNSYVNNSKTSFTHDGVGYISGTTINLRNSNGDYIVYKIEGVLKEPAMIYTGAELYEGSGIKINNGTISALLKGVMCRQTNTDQSISSSFINIKYNRLVSSIGSGVTYSNGNFVVGEGITCIKFIIDCNFYNMTGVSYFRVLPKKNGTLTGDELWYFFDSGHSGGFSQTIMLPCQSGDSFALDGIIAANYSGYLNSNSYITVEVF